MRGSYGSAMTIACRKPGWLALLMFPALWMTTIAAAEAAMPPAGAAEALARGRAQDLIVEFDGSSVDREADTIRQQRGQRHEGPDALQLRQTRYRQIKNRVRAALPAGAHETLGDYEAMPMALIRVRSSQALDALAAHRDVVGIYRDEPKYPVLKLTPQLDTQSKTLVGQPVAAAAGLTGAGTTVVVVDSGANYTVADLGPCSAVATPAATCRIQHSLYVNPANQVVGDPTAVTSASNNHGTNVASIVAGIATGTRISVVNVFGTTGTTSDSKVLAAINWSILNRAAYNIRAINLSLGDSVSHTTACTSGNPYLSAFASARTAGIVPVAASGNNGYKTGINSPACTPGAVSVGAVWAANYGSQTWYGCTDTTTGPDKVACFSNSASFLTALAPGAIITAGGLSYLGTSQASPFVAATIALLASAYPDETTADWLAHLASESKAVTDNYNAQTTARVDLAAIANAVEEANEAKVPLPPWAAVLLAGLLLTAMRRR